MKIGDKVLSGWTVREVIGKGTYATVYRVEREEFGINHSSALKVIHIPKDNTSIETLKSKGMSIQEISNCLDDIARPYMVEINMLKELKGSSNIVCYQEHIVKRGANCFSYTIMIRMELLYPLKNIIISHGLTEEDIVKIGTDICGALSVCERKNILHKDIKPDNIFCSDSGEYKLGDFGIAQTMEHAGAENSSKGTYTYMAPEVLLKNQYNNTVDLYSLAIVLYQLLNKNRSPFLPRSPLAITKADKLSAMKMRISGKRIPDIEGINPIWNRFFKIALAFNPSDRFQSPKAMKAALMQIQKLYH